MEYAGRWRRWNAWRYVLHAVERIAPEVLEDLARLAPVYREAAPQMDRPGWYIYDWESLEEAIETLEGIPSLEEALVRLRDLREALLAWAGRWNLVHPEPLSWALENLRVWAQAPDLGGKPLVYTSPMVDVPPPPPFRPPEFSPPVYGTKGGSWPEVEARLRQVFEEWLEEYRALYEEWALPHRELWKHAHWWVAHKVKGWSLRTLAKRARLEGLVDKEGRVLLEEASPSAIAKAIARLEESLGIAHTPSM
ncbi:hypothetical protein FJNA_24370 [Thermus sp. FJN-A]